jgi:CRP-like cAMP-binding protein
MNRNAPRTDGEGNFINNIILDSIPEEEFAQLKPHLELVTLEVGRKLHEPREGIQFSYFLNSGLVSLLVETAEGKSVEVGVAGYEGMTGVALAAGLTRTTHLAVMEVAGDGFRIKADIFRRVLTSAPTLKILANRFAAIEAMQIAQTAACNRLHEVGPRMARWLLMTDDRVAADCLKVTHDFLSMMLGTDRPSVTAAARKLQRQGILQYKRGTLRILHREKLENEVCECYAAIRQFNHDLGLRERPR